MKRLQWGDAPQIERITEYSMGTTTLFAFLAHAVRRKQVADEFRRAAAIVLRDLIDVTLETHPIENHIYMGFSQDANLWQAHALQGATLDLGSMKFTDAFLPFVNHWDLMVATQDPTQPGTLICSPFHTVTNPSPCAETSGYPRPLAL